MPAAPLVIRSFEGVNMSREARDIKDTELAKAVNTYMQKGGLLSQRGNVTDLLIGLAATVSPPQLPNAAVMMPFDDVNGAHHMLTCTEKLQAYGNTALFE